MLFLLNAATASAIGTLLLVQAWHVVVLGAASGSMIFFFEDRIRLDGFKFGLEVADSIAMGAAVGATTGVGKVIAIVLSFFAITAP